MATVTKTNTKQTASTENREFIPNPKYALWKPKKDGKGAAAIFEFSPQKNAFFATMMPQKSGDENARSFDNEAKILAKLGLSDIGEILRVLTGKAEGLGTKKDKYWTGLYHQNANGNCSINLSRGDYGLIFRISVSRGDDNVAYSVGVTEGEANILEMFLRTYAPNLFVVENKE